jgi:hypothetical protein
MYELKEKKWRPDLQTMFLPDRSILVDLSVENANI